MKAYESFHYWVKENLPKDSIVLELGSGVGTNILLENFKVYSIENDPKYVGLTKSNYIHAPIKNYGTYKWYDRSALENSLPEKYDIFVVDGPVGYRYGRHGVIENLDLFDTSVPWLVDDVNRPGDMAVLKGLAEKLGKDYIVFDQNDKQFGIIQ